MSNLPYIEAANQYSLLSCHYDDWSPIDWRQNVVAQGKAYANFLFKLGFNNSANVIDLTCGMGTQTIGLALHDFQTVGLDLAAGQIDRAKKEAASFNLAKQPIWKVGDALHAKEYFTQKFDVVLSCGNSIPLLGKKKYIEKFCHSVKEIINHYGVFISILLDYSELRAQRPYIIQKGLINNKDHKGVWLETGLWHADQKSFRSDVIFAYSEPELMTKHYSFPSLYAIKPEEYIELLSKAGFTKIEKLPRIDKAIPNFYSVVARLG